jgi:mRNA interferase RelE/StbE
MYQLIFTDKALKSLKSIPLKDAKRILDALESLSKNFEGKSNVKRLSNHPLAVFRLRVGHYRVLFDRQDVFRIIEVIDLGHRKNIYE